MQAPGHQRQITEGRTGPTGLPKIHSLPKTPSPYLPTKSSSRSPAPGLSFLQMSMVKRVLLLLNMEVKDDMSAAIITAIIRPRSPGEESDHHGAAELGAMGWDGMEWGGVGWNRMGGMERGGTGWNGVGWEGMGWNEVGWDGVGWDEMGWDGMEQDGMGQPRFFAPM